MDIIHTGTELAARLGSAGRVAFVPTMGNLHAGHYALCRIAREHGDTVVTSIFVNRLQFGPKDDFDRYPRTFEADCARLVDAGVHHLFAPDENELYPTPQKYIVEPDPFLQSTLEGEFRPGHFHGVATVVPKLFNIVQPHAALFGKKDYQQFMVLSNMVRELNLRIDVVPGETVRATDGLALSSRNGYLSEKERAEAPHLYRLLVAMRDKILAGARDYEDLQAEAMAELVSRGWAPQYIAVRRRSDLKSPTAHDSGLVILAAAFLGTTRLIDNLEV